MAALAGERVGVPRSGPPGETEVRVATQEPQPRERPGAGPGGAQGSARGAALEVPER